MVERIPKHLTTFWGVATIYSRSGSREGNFKRDSGTQTEKQKHRIKFDNRLKGLNCIFQFIGLAVKRFRGKKS